MKEIYFPSRKEWRAWLEKNHDKEDRIALIKYKKHTGKPSMTYREAMDEAICFGWIDTTIKKLDDARYMRRFARRTSKSKWSVNTLKYGKRLIEEGLMSPAGLKFYHEGLAKGPFDAGRSKNPRIPSDLKKELNKNKTAEKNFRGFAPSYRRTFLRWLEGAKLPETRKKRIDIILGKAEANDKRWG